jgi:hypothetical protein
MVCITHKQKITERMERWLNESREQYELKQEPGKDPERIYDKKTGHWAKEQQEQTSQEA